MMPELPFLLNQAFHHFQNGRIDAAGDLLTKALRIQSKNFDALHLLGVIKGIQNQHEKAKILLKKAVQINPNDGFVHFNLAKALSEVGRDAESLMHHKMACQLLPNAPEVWLNYGKSLDNLNQTNEALNCYDKALTIHPNHPEALANRGASLYELGRHEESLLSLKKALALNPTLSSAWHNQGTAFYMLKRHSAALHSFDQAIAIKPAYHEAHNNRGATLCEQLRWGDALDSYDRAIAINPDYAEAHIGRSIALTQLKQLESALVSYYRALALKPDIDYGRGYRLHIKMLLCDWCHLDQDIRILIQNFESSSPQRVTAPFEFLACPSTPAQQRQCAEIYVKDKFSAIAPATFSSPAPHKKIKIGYFSSDFRDHPVGKLTVGLFESHNRNQFEIYGFGLIPPDSSPLGTRLSMAFDHFVDLSSMELLESVARVRACELDIGINLNGYTTHNRTELFNQRIAPIQVNYLGYPGTMGTGFMDYIVGDTTIIPHEDADFYTEKVAYLPHSFFVSTYTDNPNLPLPTRQAENLPQCGFVYCCFNNSFKITPDVFDVWMRLLNQVEGSVLWLSKHSASVVRNLRQEAEKRGVAGDRIIFAEHVDDWDAHLKRLQLADLFVDTFQYNAHTTAADALWAGLPVLTCLGQSFPSRVASSLLNAVGLPELVTQNHGDYEALALTLAAHPEKLAAIKEKLARNRLTQPLFDTALTTRHLEAAYTSMMERHRQGLPPDTIAVAA